MAILDLHLDLDALLIDGALAAAVNSLARSVAANAQHTTEAGVLLPIIVDEYTTDRRAASVTIAHAAGLAAQAKHGVLTKAAASVGLEVRAR